MIVSCLPATLPIVTYLVQIIARIRNCSEFYSAKEHLARAVLILIHQECGQALSKGTRVYSMIHRHSQL